MLTAAVHGLLITRLTDWALTFLGPWPLNAPGRTDPYPIPISIKTLTPYTLYIKRGPTTSGCIA